MTDSRPPRVRDGERATLVAALGYLRTCVVRKADRLTDEHARWSPVATGTSMLWLIKHLARGEVLWVVDRFAGAPFHADLVDDTVRDDDMLADAIARYQAVWTIVDDIVEAAELDAVCVGEDDQLNPDLRWVLVHCIEETARHAGHADLLRELIDGRTGR